MPCLLRQFTDIKNEVPDGDGIWEIGELWKNQDGGKMDSGWMERLDWLLGRLETEKEA